MSGPNIGRVSRLLSSDKSLWEELRSCLEGLTACLAAAPVRLNTKKFRDTLTKSLRALGAPLSKRGLRHAVDAWDHGQQSHESWARMFLQLSADPKPEEIGKRLEEITLRGRAFFEDVRAAIEQFSIKLLEETEPVAEEPAGTVAVQPGKSNGALEFQPGGFVYRGQVNELSGKPLKVLRELSENRWHRVSRDDLRKAVWSDVIVADGTVNDVVKQVRLALRAAMKKAKVKNAPSNPLRAVDQGGDCAWKLELP